MLPAQLLALRRRSPLRITLAIFGVIFLVSACTAVPSQAIVDTAHSTVTQTTGVESTVEPVKTTFRDSTPTDSPTSEPKRERERTFYDLDVLFDYHNRHLVVKQRIEYSNPSDTPLEELVLMVETNRYDNTFDLESLIIDGVSVTDFSLAKNVLTVPLVNVFGVGDRMVIELQFTLTIMPIAEPSSDHRPELFGYTERQINLVDWYPMVAYYQAGQGWLSHPAWYYGEHQVYEPARYRVGLQLAEPVPDLVIAASSPAFVQDNKYIYSLDAARNFVFSASTQYQIATASVGDIVVTSYSFPFDALAGQDALKYTVEALQIYTRLFGPYPQKSLSVVEADFLDGMEFEGLYFLSKGFYNIYDGQPGSYLGAISVHETAHQWWYSQVGNDQALEPWLDEALCTYSEYLFFEAHYPEAIPWWQQVRVAYYEPEGKIDLPIYDYNGYIPYRNAVYLRGALFLHDLRQVIGDDSFYAAIRSIVETYRYGRLITAEDFFAAVSEQSDQGFPELITEYFSNP